MKSVKQFVLLACACLLGCTAASATTIDFTGIPGASVGIVRFTGWDENGYTVSPLVVARGGSWRVNKATTWGDPSPSINSVGFGATVQVTQDGGGTFTFSGVDLDWYGSCQDSPSGCAAGNYTISGYLAGVQIFTDTGADGFRFQEYGTAYGADTIDRLTVTTDISQVVDNIVVNATPISATPEPGSLALVLTGAAGMAAMLRRRIAGGAVQFLGENL